MKIVPWRTAGARLHLPRDLRIAYAVGRMGLVTIADVFPLWYGSPVTARFGFGRLRRLGLLRTFARENPLAPAWFSLTAQALEWVAEEVGCDERELRAVAGIRRTNLAAISMRNRFWTSLVLAARANPTVRIEMFRPEWELRPLRPEAVRIVPDAIVTLATTDETKPAEVAWFIEMDAATERSAIWTAKANAYRSLRDGGPVYGVAKWSVLACVPSPRRARTVAAAVTAAGAGAFSFVAVAANLEGGRAFDRAIWPCVVLAANPSAAPSIRLVDRLGTPINDPDQHPRSAADRLSSIETGVLP